MSADGPALLLERDAAIPLIHAGLSTRSGADEDPEGLEGLSRIAGRLMRRTAGGKSPDEVDARVDRMGASLGLDAGHGGVALSGVVLERSFADFMALLEETLTAPGLAEDELERLKRETNAELIEILDSDQQLAQRWFLRSVFAGHPYGRTVIGSERSLAAIGVADVRRCLEREFRRSEVRREAEEVAGDGKGQARSRSRHAAEEGEASGQGQKTRRSAGARAAAQQGNHGRVR